MKSRRLAFFTMLLIVAASVTVAVSVMVSEDAFAKDGRYSGDTSQAASVSNECLNPILDSNTIDNIVDVGNCAGTVSQQDESGQAGATTTHQSANPTLELQRSQPSETQPPPPNLTCEVCLDVLTDEQEQAFVEALNEPTTEQFCELYSILTAIQRAQANEEIESALVTAGVEDDDTIRSILICLQNSVG